MRNNKIIVNIYTLLGFILLFPYIKPASFQTNNLINFIYNSGQIFSLIIMLIIVMTNILKRKYKISNITITIIIFYLILTISTIINKNDILNVIKYIIPVILFTTLLDSLKKKHLLDFLNGMIILIMLLTIINFFTVILFPNGMSYGTTGTERYYFLGHNNSVVRFLFPGIVFSGIYDYLKNNKLCFRTYFLTIIISLSVTISWSNTAMIGCYIMLFFEFLLKDKKINILFSGKKIFFIMILIFFFIVLQNNISFFNNIITNVFNKDITLSGRTIIWEYAIQTIKEKFILGYGYGAAIPQISNWQYEPSSFHNYFLDLMFRGGILLLLTKLNIVWQCCKSLTKKVSNLSYFLTFCLLAYFVMWQFEPFMSSGYICTMLVLLLSYKCNKINVKQ